MTTNKNRNRCLYHATFSDFIKEKAEYILGCLHSNFHGETLTTTDEAWQEEILLLQKLLLPWKDEEAEVIFEYDIPRLGKRIDVVLLLRGLIFCLEFKVGQKQVLQSNVEQVMDYALDLKNFHLYSQDRVIVPILVPTKHSGVTEVLQPSAYDGTVYNPMIAGAETLQGLIKRVLKHAGASPCECIKNWVISPYSPTPTIIEAAKSLYANHSVEDITRHEADKVSTDRTIAYILDVIKQTKEKGEKSICFVTGVPGAGKTLVGLEIAIRQSFDEDDNYREDEGAVYLSGNGPLVAVLSEALARDDQKKCSKLGKKKYLSDSRREISKSIQMIHRYRDNMLQKIKNPVENGILEIDPEKAVRLQKTGYGEVEHVAIFDEAQRSWTHKRLADYLKRGGTYGNKLKVPNFPMSEAAFLIWSLDQREDWATIICLVGGGQEINTGEAGIAEWIRALNEHFTNWNIYISDKLTDKEYAEGHISDLLSGNHRVTYSPELHLAVSLRSFRAESLSAFVHSLLTFGTDTTRLYKEVMERNYPILLTRDMEKARTWLRSMSHGTQQMGILVSKVAARFKPLAVNILAQGDENAIHWFLEDKTDVRSSNFLEDAATEIQVQGLELDYACVLWDADMRYADGAWQFFNFNGRTAWTQITGKTENQQDTMKYMLNAYRVLLTRARQGIVICVPYGDGKKNSEGFPEDPTRLPEFYDATYEYFKSIGIKEI